MIAICAGFVFLLAMIPIVGTLMYARRERLLTHADHMKALELGAALLDDATAARIKAAAGKSAGDDDGSRRSLVRECFSTAIWVAFWGFAFAASLGEAVRQ